MSQLLHFLRERINHAGTVEQLLEEWLLKFPDRGDDFTRLMLLCGVRAPVRIEGNRIGVKVRMMRPFDGLASSVALFVSDIPMQPTALNCAVRRRF